MPLPARRTVVFTEEVSHPGRPLRRPRQSPSGNSTCASGWPERAGNRAREPVSHPCRQAPRLWTGAPCCPVRRWSHRSSTGSSTAPTVDMSGRTLRPRTADRRRAHRQGQAYAAVSHESLVRGPRRRRLAGDLQACIGSRTSQANHHLQPCARCLPADRSSLAFDGAVVFVLAYLAWSTTSF